jgi:DNA-binding NtrC family response regulator
MPPALPAKLRRALQSGEVRRVGATRALTIVARVVAATKLGRDRRLSAEALQCLLRYPWPGNVRELENAMERAAILSKTEVVAPDDLPPHVAAGITLGRAPALPAQQTLAAMERAHILQTLERCGWNQSRAAEALGLGRTTLWRKPREYGLGRASE